MDYVGSAGGRCLPLGSPSASSGFGGAGGAGSSGTARSTYQLGQIRPIDPTHGAHHPEQALGGPRAGAKMERNRSGPGIAELYSACLYFGIGNTRRFSAQAATPVG